MSKKRSLEASGEVALGARPLREFGLAPKARALEVPQGPRREQFIKDLQTIRAALEYQHPFDPSIRTLYCKTRDTESDLKKYNTLIEVLGLQNLVPLPLYEQLTPAEEAEVEHKGKKRKEEKEAQAEAETGSYMPANRLCENLTVALWQQFPATRAYIVTRIIGSGSYGTVLEVVDTQKPFLGERQPKALKLFRDSAFAAQHEYNMQLVFANRGIAPRPSRFQNAATGQLPTTEELKDFKTKPLFMLEMPLIDGVLGDWMPDIEVFKEAEVSEVGEGKRSEWGEVFFTGQAFEPTAEASETELASKIVRYDKAKLDYLFTQIERLIRDLKTANITHGDMHWSNIAFTVPPLARDNPTEAKPRLWLIDFGKATDKFAAPIIEWIQLYRTSHWTGSKATAKSKYLHKKVYEYMQKAFPKTMAGVADNYTEFMNKVNKSFYLDWFYKNRVAAEKWARQNPGARYPKSPYPKPWSAPAAVPAVEEKKKPPSPPAPAPAPALEKKKPPSPASPALALAPARAYASGPSPVRQFPPEQVAYFTFPASLRSRIRHALPRP